jgi:hypothetical protein
MSPPDVGFAATLVAASLWPQRSAGQDGVMQRRRHNIAAIAVFTSYAAVLAAAVTFSTFVQLSRNEIEDARKAAAQAAADGRLYVGTIVLPGETAGRCRHFDFDNITGSIREGTGIQCPYESFSTEDAPSRVDVIREAFSKR